MSAADALKLLYRGSGPVQTLIVVVPGVGTLLPNDWHDGHGESWLYSSSLATSNHQAVFVFNHTLGEDTTLAWHRVQTEGGRLLHALEYVAVQEEFEHCPIVLVAHSLGGVVLKRAICSGRRRKKLPENVACVVLISCPHSRKPQQEKWQSIARITKAVSKYNFRDAISSHLAESLADDCSDFGEEYHSVPLFSIFEAVETKVPDASYNAAVLVNKKLATVGGDRETVRSVKFDHLRSCCFDTNKPTFKELQQFLTTAVQSVRETFGNRSSTSETWDQDHSTARDSTGLSQTVGTSLSKRSPTWSSETDRNDFRSLTAEVGHARADPKLPCFFVPYDKNSGFWGRSESLTKIADVLCQMSTEDQAGSSSIASYALSGVGGIGKTQVAIEFAHRYKQEFDAIFWIPADESEKMIQTFADIAIRLGLVHPDSVDAQSRLLTRDLVLGWLSRPVKSYPRRGSDKISEASWLLIFDNVESPDILNDFWPRDATGSVLVTSRDPLSESHFYRIDKGDVLPAFDVAESADFLLELASRNDDHEDVEHAREVAEILGGVPLAIVQLAGLIARKQISFLEFLKEFGDEDRRMEMLRRHVIPLRAKDYQHTLASVWGFESLKQSADLLDVLSFLDPDGISEYILKPEQTSDAPDFSSEQALISYEGARTELLQSSLITRNRSDKKLVIHRVIQDTARARMDSERYSTVFTRALQLIAAAWPYEDDSAFRNETYKRGDIRWNKTNELYSHILILRKHSRTRKQQPPTDFTPDHLKPPKVLLKAAWFSLMRAGYEDALDLLQMADSMFEPLKRDIEGQESYPRHVSDDFQAQVRLFQHHCGTLSLHINRPKDSLSYLKAFKRMVEVKENKRPQDQEKGQDLGVALNELGNAYLQNNNPTHAEQCFHQSYAELEHFTGATINTVSMPRISLGFALLLQGRLEEADAVFAKASEDRENAHGVDDTVSFATGKLCLGHGNVKAAQGKLDESFILHKRCVLQYRGTVGAFHHRTADGSVKLADHHIRLKDYATAKSLLNDASKVYRDRKLFVPERARVAYKQWKICDLLGEHAEAEEAAGKAESLHRETHPTDYRQVTQLEDDDFDKDIMFWSR